MKIIIDIPESDYVYIVKEWQESTGMSEYDSPAINVFRAIKKGTQINEYPQVTGITPTVILPTDPYIGKEVGE